MPRPPDTQLCLSSSLRSQRPCGGRAGRGFNACSPDKTVGRGRRSGSYANMLARCLR